MFLCPSLQQSYQAALFDLDGTLIDSVPDLAQSIDLMLKELEQPAAGEARVRAWVGNGAVRLVERALAWAEAEQNLAQPLPFDEAYASFLRIYTDHCCDLSVLYPGVLEGLEALKAKGVSMAVVTNKPILFTQLMLNHYGLEEYFSCVVGGDSLAEKKPSALPMQHAMAHLGSDSQTTLMVGDSVTDIKAARAAGCAVVALPYGYNHGEDIHTSGADAVIESLTELYEA